MAVPRIFGTQAAGNVPASYLDEDFAYVLSPPEFIIGTPQTDVGQLLQVFDPFADINATSDILRVQLGAFDTDDELGSTTNGSFSNWAVVGATRIPAGVFTGIATWPSGGLAGYALTDNPDISAVGVYGSSGLSAAGSGGVSAGANFAATNTTIQSGLADSGQDFNVVYGVEADVVIKAKAGTVSPAGAYVAGFTSILNADIAPTVNAYSAFLASTVNLPWEYGLLTINASALTGIALGALANAGPSDSQPIVMTALSSASAAYQGNIRVSPGTGLILENTTKNAAFIIGEVNNTKGTLSYHVAGETNVLQIINNTVNVATGAVLSLETGTANSFFNFSLTDAGTAIMEVGSGVSGGLVITTSGTSLSSLLRTSSGVAVGAGSASQAWIYASSTSGLGIYYGTGNPSFAAAKGSIYSNTTASIATARLWTNSDGGTTWVFATMSA